MKEKIEKLVCKVKEKGNLIAIGAVGAAAPLAMATCAFAAEGDAALDVAGAATQGFSVATSAVTFMMSNPLLAFAITCSIVIPIAFGIFRRAKGTSKG